MHDSLSNDPKELLAELEELVARDIVQMRGNSTVIGHIHSITSQALDVDTYRYAVADKLRRYAADVGTRVLVEFKQMALNRWIMTVSKILTD